MTDRPAPPFDDRSTGAPRRSDSPGMSETGKLRILTALEIEAARSETARTQEALKESEARFRTLFESSPDGIFITDPDTLEVLDCNAKACEMNGYSRAELVGQSINLLHPPEIREQTKGGAEGRAQFVEQLRARGVITVESVHVRKDGSRFPMETSMCLLELEGRDVVMGIDRDISERRRAEKELARHREHLEELVRARTAELENAIRELESFSYSVAHDLRAPLRAMDGWGAVLLEEHAGLLDEEGRRYLDRIRKAAGRMGHLIDGLLNLARISRRELVEGHVDLTALARSVAAERSALEPERDVTVTVAEGMTAEGDPRLLHAVLENLIDNAFKFTSTRASALVEVGRVERDGETVFFVRDDGVGFDMAWARKLFNPFQRLHGVDEFPGTGIGLATVQRIVARHGGRIWAESAPGAGATFLFTLRPGASVSDPAP